MARQIRKKAMIQTERLTLKPFSELDMDGLLDILTTPEVTDTFMVPETGSRRDLEELVQTLISFSRMEDEKHLEYGIYLNEQIIGFVNDCGIEDDEIEIGYVVHPRCQGQGYATEAVHAVITELHEMGFRKIVAGYFAENTASLRVMEKCGMRQTDKTGEEEYRGRKHICRYCELCFD